MPAEFRTALLATQGKPAVSQILLLSTCPRQLNNATTPTQAAALSYEELVEQERIREYGKGKPEGEDGDGPAQKKAKKESKPGFFKLEDKNNPHAYVIGLPTENFDVEQFKALDARRKQADVDSQNLLAERKARLAGLCRLTGWQHLTHHTDHSAQSALLWVWRALDGAHG